MNFWLTVKKIFFLMCPKFIEKIQFFFIKLGQLQKIYIFPEKVLLETYKVASTTHRTSITESWKIYAQSHRATKHIFLRKLIPSNCLLGHVRRIFDNPAYKVSTKCLKMFVSISQIDERTQSFLKKNIFPLRFAQTVCLDT